MNGQSYYQYQLTAAGGYPGLVLPHNYVAAPHAGGIPAQTLIHPQGYSFVPPPPPPVAAVAPVDATDYSGSTISAPPSLYSSASASTQSTSPNAQRTTTTNSVAVTEVVSSSHDAPKTAEVVQEPVVNKLDTPNGSTPVNEAPSSSVTLASQMSAQAMLSIQQKQAAELQQALARSPMPAYGIQKTAHGLYPGQMQVPTYASQTMVVMDAYGRQFIVENPAFVPKVQTMPMVAGANYLQSYAIANPGAKLHTSATVEIPQSQQAAYSNLYLPNGYVPTQAMQPQAQYAMPGGYYAPSTTTPVAQDPAQVVQRQQLVQYNGQTYLMVVPQQIVARKY